MSGLSVAHTPCRKACFKLDAVSLARMVRDYEAELPYLRPDLIRDTADIISGIDTTRQIPRGTYPRFKSLSEASLML